MLKNKIVKMTTTVLSTVLFATAICSCMQSEPESGIESMTEFMVASGTDTSSITQEYTTTERGGYTILSFNDEASLMAARDELTSNGIFPTVNGSMELCDFGISSDLISYASKNDILPTDRNARVVVIIDSGASSGRANERYTTLGNNEDLPEDERTNLDPEDDNEHGNKTCDWILNNDNDNAYIISIKAFGKDGKSDIIEILEALQIVSEMERRPDYVLMPFSMAVAQNMVNDFHDLTQAMDGVINSGTKIVVAAGNNGNYNAAWTVPAGLTNAAIVVGSMRSAGNATDTTNVGRNVDYWVKADSTSEAAAKYIGYVLANNISGNSNVSTTRINYVSPEPPLPTGGHGDRQCTVFTRRSIEGAGYASSREFSESILQACDSMVPNHNNNRNGRAVSYSASRTSHSYHHGYADCVTFTQICYYYAYERHGSFGISCPNIDGDNDWPYQLNWRYRTPERLDDATSYGTFYNGNGGHRIPGYPDVRHYYQIPNCHGVTLYPMNGWCGLNAWMDIVADHTVDGRNLSTAADEQPAPMQTDVLLLEADQDAPVGYEGLYLRPGDMVLLHASSKNNKKGKYYHVVIYGGHTSSGDCIMYGATNFGQQAVRTTSAGVSGAIAEMEDMIPMDETFVLDGDTGQNWDGFYIIHYEAFGGCAHADFAKTFTLSEYNDLCEAYGENNFLSMVSIRASSATTNTGSFYYGQSVNDTSTPLLVVAPGQTITTITLAEMEKTVSGNTVTFNWPDSYWRSGSTSTRIDGFGPIWHYTDPPQITFTEVWAIDAAYPE